MLDRTNGYPTAVARLIEAGIGRDDADALRRISMTLHRWHELECGDGNGCIERDEETGKPYWHHANSNGRWPMPDRERGALKRLEAIMAKYPGWAHYVQGDPRGCALYILSPEVLAGLPNGKDASERNLDGYYNRGIAVRR